MANVGYYGFAVAQETAAQATFSKIVSFVLICQWLTALLLSSGFSYVINPDELKKRFFCRLDYFLNFLALWLLRRVI